MDVFLVWLPIIFVLLQLPLIVVSVKSVLDSSVDGAAKLAWMALILLVPLLGSVLWFALSRTLQLR